MNGEFFLTLNGSGPHSFREGAPMFLYWLFILWPVCQVASASFGHHHDAGDDFLRIPACRFNHVVESLAGSVIILDDDIDSCDCQIKQLDTGFVLVTADVDCDALGSLRHHTPPS